jgi:NitT/TauT family transport system substrate-binding protein
MNRALTFFVVSLLLLSGCVAHQGTVSQETNTAESETSGATMQGDSLAPQPLDEPTTVVVASAGKLETLSPLFLGEFLGEFEKENLELEFVTLPAPEAFLALGQGAIDVAASGITGAFFNAVASGAEFRLVLPAASGSEDDGLWLAANIVENGFPTDRRIIISTPVGPSSPIMVPIQKYLETEGLFLEGVDIVKIPVGEGAFSLERGLVDAAYLYSPEYLALADEGAAVRVAGFDREQANVGYVFGMRLLEAEPDVGEAFARALLRTTRDYLQDDYKKDPETLVALSEALQLTPEELQVSGSYYFPERIETTLFTDAQTIWQGYPDILSYDGVLEPSAFLDERFVFLEPRTDEPRG